jgi:hypothetical protein
MPFRPDDLVDDIMRSAPYTIRVFLEFRMACVGCPIACFTLSTTPAASTASIARNSLQRYASAFRRDQRPDPPPSLCSASTKIRRGSRRMMRWRPLRGAGAVCAVMWPAHSGALLHVAAFGWVAAFAGFAIAFGPLLVGSRWRALATPRVAVPAR